MSTDSVPRRRRGAPTAQEKALGRRRARARKILARADVQDIIAQARRALDIPPATFRHNERGYGEWEQAMKADALAAETRDADTWETIFSTLQAAGVEWPEHWAISARPATRKMLLSLYIHAIKMLGHLDDTWNTWAFLIIVRGTPLGIGLPSDDDRAPRFLPTSIPGLLVSIGDQSSWDTGPIQIPPSTSRPIIYVDDDMQPDDACRALHYIRQRQSEPPSEKGHVTADPTLAPLIEGLVRHLEQGMSWGQLHTTQAGQQLLARLGQEKTHGPNRNNPFYNYPALREAHERGQQK